MNEFETTRTDAGDPLAGEDLKQRCAELERQTIILHVALVVLSCALCVFIGIQWKQARSELANIKPGTTLVIQNYYQKEKPSIDTLLARLGEFGRTNPDFRPILARYGIPIPTAPPAQPASTPKK